MQPLRMLRRVVTRLTGASLPEAALPVLPPEHTSVVTGASSGIGLQTAVGLARAGSTVWIVGRSSARTEESLAQVRSAAGHERVHACLADFSDLTEVRALCERLASALPRLDVLVNNAGVWHPEHKLTAQGIEDTLGVNHLAHFVLTLGLLDLLEASEARIVTVSSRLHITARGVSIDDPAWARRPYRGLEAYAESKLANVLFAKALARRLERASSVAVHPGDVATDVTRDNAWLSRGARLVAPMLLTPWEGAQTTLHAAVADKARALNGAYFSDLAVAEAGLLAGDEALQERLWAWSLDRAGLEDPHTRD